MSITDARLARIADLTKKIEEKSTWLETKQAELIAMQEIAASMDATTMLALSQSASTSLIRRGIDEASGIAEAAARDIKIIEELQKAIDDAEVELAALEKEKTDLEEFTGKV